jgi:hypothetical protein
MVCMPLLVVAGLGLTLLLLGCCPWVMRSCSAYSTCTALVLPALMQLPLTLLAFAFDAACIRLTRVPGGVLHAGTSMAAPHVSAVAALVWSAFTACPGYTIRAALKAAALDLGTPGTDEEFGAGLVQARAAYDYLLGHPCATAAWPARRYLPPPPAASPPLRPPPPPPSPRPVPAPSSSRQPQSGARRPPPPPVGTRRAPVPVASRRSPPPPASAGARRAQVLSASGSRLQGLPWVRPAAQLA